MLSVLDRLRLMLVDVEGEPHACAEVIGHFGWVTGKPGTLKKGLAARLPLRSIVKTNATFPEIQSY